MGKALVIRDVDFSTNKLATVQLYNAIPCVGITLDQSALSMIKVGSTATLTATVTPFNTTDVITWTSSNPSVASVVGGVVTQNGVGTATITAQCGSRSATCTVTSTHVLADSDMWHVDGYGAIGADLSTTPPKNYVYEQAHQRYKLYTDDSVYTDNPSGKYRALADKNNALPGYAKNAIEIPYGATQMVIASPTNAGLLCIAWQNNAQESGYYTDRTAFAAVTQYDGAIAITGLSSYTVDLTQLPSGTNSFVMSVYSNTNAAETFGDITITFS